MCCVSQDAPPSVLGVGLHKLFYPKETTWACSLCPLLVRMWGGGWGRGRRPGAALFPPRGGGWGGRATVSYTGGPLNSQAPHQGGPHLPTFADRRLRLGKSHDLRACAGCGRSPVLTARGQCLLSSPGGWTRQGEEHGVSYGWVQFSTGGCGGRPQHPYVQSSQRWAGAEPACRAGGWSLHPGSRREASLGPRALGSG